MTGSPYVGCLVEADITVMQPGPSSGRILVIDDDNEVRGMLCRVLQEAGYEPEAAENGDIALALFRVDPAELIITDIFMPGMAGLEAITELRKEAPEVPIIAISGGWRGSDLDFLSVAQSMGATRTFRKPLEREQLIEAVDQLLGHERRAAQ
jgi:CheY-like chemotaxis protein